MKNQRGFTSFELTVVIIWLAAIIGWVGNLVQVIQVLNVKLTDITVLTIVKIIGIFAAPLGSILGWIGFFS